MEQFDLGDTPATTAKARWAEALVTAGALAVSVRGLVEPARITRAELRRRRRQYLQDVTERYQAGKMSDGQQEETLAELEAIENAYAQGGPPTLVDCHGARRAQRPVRRCRRDRLGDSAVSGSVRPARAGAGRGR